MSKFDAWARERSRRKNHHAEPEAPIVRNPQPAPRAIVVPGVPAQTPQPMVTVAQGPRAPLWAPAQAPRVQTCYLVRPGDRDPYAELLASTPELDVPNLNPEGYDAMKAPSMNPSTWNPNGRWSPTARSSYGTRDLDGQTALESHVPAKYGNSLADIRR